MEADQSIQSKEERRASISALENAMRALPQIFIQIDHFFAPGIYLRQMTMPKESLVIGKIHKTEHYCILAKGSVTVATEDEKKTYHAPAVIHAMPGAKRSLFAHEESVWVNVHHNPTDERDIDKIDEIFVTDSFEKFLEFQNQGKIEGGSTLCLSSP